MPCTRVFLSIGVPLGNLEGIRLPGLFEGRGWHIWVPFWTQRKCGTEEETSVHILCECEARLHSDIHNWVTSFWTLRILEN